MSQITEQIQQIKETLSEHTRLIAVSKTHTNEAIMEAYHGGHKVFGENKAQELIQKQAELPTDIEWHMIGHLQSNKVKYIAPFVALIHAVDSLKLLKMINKEGKKNKRVLKCLLQMHIAQEDTKFGLNCAEIEEILQSEAYQQMENVEIAGLMGMATYTDNETQIRNEFSELRQCFTQLRKKYFTDKPGFKELSMGMSNDYQIAVEEGSTLVRIGSSIFGARDYQ